MVQAGETRALRAVSERSYYHGWDKRCRVSALQCIDSPTLAQAPAVWVGACVYADTMHRLETAPLDVEYSGGGVLRHRGEVLQIEQFRVDAVSDQAVYSKLLQDLGDAAGAATGAGARTQGQSDSDSPQALSKLISKQGSSGEALVGFKDAYDLARKDHVLRYPCMNPLSPKLQVSSDGRRALYSNSKAEWATATIRPGFARQHDGWQTCFFRVDKTTKQSIFIGIARSSSG